MSVDEMEVNKMIDKFMMELAAPASKHTATGSVVFCYCYYGLSVDR